MTNIDICHSLRQYDVVATARHSTPEDLMSEGILTREAILAATEEVLRQYGPSKATVVDVARVLGVSHGTVYRHFPSKVALREAVTERWLDRAHHGLADIVVADLPADVRLIDWQRALFHAKLKKALDDPQLFATYSVLTGESSGVVLRHLETLVEQLETIVNDGITSGLFASSDPKLTARALFDATVRFHDPHYVSEWTRSTIEDEFEAVCALILDGLRPRPRT